MAVRVVVLLGLALVIGVGTIIFAKRWIASVQQPTVTETVVQEVVPDSFVLVAQGNLQPGMLLGPESFRWQGWPTEDLPPSYIVQGQRSESELFGAVVRYQIAAGEPITGFKIAMPGQQGFLAAVLNPGMRAVTIPISETRAGAGFILPGDRVDVVLTHDVGGATVSETVFFDMRILAIDQALSNPENLPRVGKFATLEVTPREVEAFILMQQMGVVSLSLRSLQPGDDEDAPLDDQQIAARGKPTPPDDLTMAEKPEAVEKVPAIYAGEVPGEGPGDVAGEVAGDVAHEVPSEVAGDVPAEPINESVASAIGQELGEIGLEDPTDEHTLRRQSQTYTSTRDISVLFGGGDNTGTVIVFRGNASQ